MNTILSSIFMSLATFAMTMAGSATLARWASPELFGSYLAFLSCAGIATAIFNFGMTEITLREVARAARAGANRRQVLSALGHCFMVPLCTSIPAAAAASALAFMTFSLEQAATLLILLVSQAILMGLAQIGGCVLRGSGSPIWGQFGSGFIPHLVVLVLATSLWQAGVTPGLLLMTLVAVAGPIAGLTLIALKTLQLLSALPKQRAAYRPMPTRKLVRLAMPVAASVGVNIANVHVTAISLAFFHEPVTVTFYQSSMQLCMIFAIIYAQLSMMGVGNLIRAEDHRARLGVIRMMTLYALAAGVIIGGFYLLFPEQVPGLILGYSDPTLTATFVICVIAAALPALSIASQPYLIWTGMTSLLLRAAAMAALTNLIASTLLGYWYGSVGAACGLLLSTLVMTALMLSFGRRTYQERRSCLGVAAA